MNPRLFARTALTLGLLLSAAPAAAQSELEQEKLKWMNLITFFGEEETGDFSLRVFDKDVKERADFRFQELWKYDLDSKRWIKIDDKPQTARVVMPNEKGPNSPPDTQLLASLPVSIKTPGVFYAKWRINRNVEGATFTRIGPNVLGRDPPAGPRPEKHIVMDVPIDQNKAVRMWIPDPRFHTGQAAEDKPTTRPAGR